MGIQVMTSNRGVPEEENAPYPVSYLDVRFVIWMVQNPRTPTLQKWNKRRQTIYDLLMAGF